jgi:hypothetical protein
MATALRYGEMCKYVKVAFQVLLQNEDTSKHLASLQARTAWGIQGVEDSRRPPTLQKGHP